MKLFTYVNREAGYDEYYAVVAENAKQAIDLMAKVGGFPVEGELEVTEIGTAVYLGLTSYSM